MIKQVERRKSFIPQNFAVKQETAHPLYYKMKIFFHRLFNFLGQYHLSGMMRGAEIPAQLYLFGSSTLVDEEDIFRKNASLLHKGAYVVKALRQLAVFCKNGHDYTQRIASSAEL